MTAWQDVSLQIERPGNSNGTSKYTVVCQWVLNDSYTLWIAPNITITCAYRWEFVTVDAGLDLRVLAQGLGRNLPETKAAAERWLVKHVASLVRSVQGG